MFRQGHVNTGKKDKGYFLSVYPYFSFLFFYIRILLTLKAIGDTEVTHERPLFSFSEKPYGFFPGIRNAYEANIENADDSYTENAYKAVPKHNWAIHLREGKGRSKNLLGSMVMLSTYDVFQEK